MKINQAILLVAAVWVCDGFHLQHQAAVRRRVCMRSQPCCPGHICRAFQRFDTSRPVAVCARRLLSRPLYSPGTPAQLQFCGGGNRLRGLPPGFGRSGQMFDRQRNIFEAQSRPGLQQGRPIGRMPLSIQQTRTRTATATFQGQMPNMFQGQMPPSSFRSQMQSTFQSQTPNTFQRQMPGAFQGQMPSTFQRPMPGFRQPSTQFGGQRPPLPGGQPGFGPQQPGNPIPVQLPAGQLNTFADIPRNQLPFIRQRGFMQGSQPMLGQGQQPQQPPLLPQRTAIEQQRPVMQRPVPFARQFPISPAQHPVPPQPRQFPMSPALPGMAVPPQPRFVQQSPTIIQAIPVPQQTASRPQGQGPTIVQPAPVPLIK